MKKTTLTLCALMLTVLCFGKGQKKRVLFIGNSYTYSNDLPKMIADMATSTGDTLVYDSHTPGGYTFEQHASDATTLSKIDLGNWDYVVLQEQSQRPAFPITQVETQVFPYAKILNDRIKAKNLCGETIFYMTWGRKNGDATNCPFYPPICLFTTMNDELRARYEIMADRNDAMLAPVAAVWRSVRTTKPTLELYVPDESHPSVAGTYVAACSFYATIFQNNPSTVSFTAGLAAADADLIRTAAKQIAFDSLSKWKVGENDPTADFNFSFTPGSKTVTFTNTSLKATSYSWDFGDGFTDVTAAPSHTYATSGSYTVTLVARICNRTDTIRKLVNLGGTGIAETREGTNLFPAYPNPFNHSISLDLSALQGSTEISVYNYLGAEVYRKQENSGSIITLDLNHLAKGPYLLKLSNEQGLITTHRLLKRD